MNLTETTVEAACDTLRKAIDAAENSNHNGEVFVVAAAAALAMKEVLGKFLPRSIDFRNRAWPDATLVPLDVTLGELRAMDAALALAEGRSL